MRANRGKGPCGGKRRRTRAESRDCNPSMPLTANSGRGLMRREAGPEALAEHTTAAGHTPA
jgi:hypothetical protein